jgi:hypothetical protein
MMFAMSLEVKIKPIKFGHKVGVRWTNTDWKTHNDSIAYWYHNNAEVDEEVWGVDILSLSPNKSNYPYISFAIFVREDDGTEYWDNNFGKNYSV